LEVSCADVLTRYAMGCQDIDGPAYHLRRTGDQDVVRPPVAMVDDDARERSTAVRVGGPLSDRRHHGRAKAADRLEVVETVALPAPPEQVHEPLVAVPAQLREERLHRRDADAAGDHQQGVLGSGRQWQAATGPLEPDRVADRGPLDEVL